MNRFEFRRYNFILVMCAMALNVIGILIINSATGGSQSLVQRQIIGVCAGIVVMGIISFIPYHSIFKISVLIYLGCLFFLALVLVLGIIRGGARRWVVLPVIGQLQPSEFAKVGLIIVGAAFLGENADEINSARTLILAVIGAAIPLGLILLEPDLSTSIIIIVTVAAMIFAAGVSWKIILIVLAIVCPLAAGALFVLENGSIPFINEYQINRILAFIHPDRYLDENLQQNNSIMAIASGQMWGKGLNNNALESVKNGNFLAEEQTDFIFAVIGEEMGFVGCCAVIALFALIVFLCFWMGHKARDMHGRIICAGVGTLIAFQSFTNIAVATGIFPNTGLPLPFISYGVSSLLSMYAGLGLVLSTGLEPVQKQKIRRFKV